MLAWFCLVVASSAQTNLRGVSLSPPASGLPAMKYRFASFATAAPADAAAFCVKYFGGVEIQKSQFQTHRTASASATISAVRFPYGHKEFHDVYFVNDPSKPTGPMSPAKYEDYLHKLHRFDIEETWDWYQDWHLCFNVEDVDLIAYRLLRDGVPFVTRSSYSFYVEIPFGITFQFLGSKLTLVWSELFNFCRYTDGTGKTEQNDPKNFQIGEMPDPLPAIPQLPPSHHSYFSTIPDVAFNFTLAHTSGTAFNMNEVWQESHRYSDGRCALLRWVQYPSFQVHFVDQFRKHQGNFTTKQVESMLTTLHGDMSNKDAFFDFRIGFEVNDLRPFMKSLDQKEQKYMYVTEDGVKCLYMQLPGGIIFELVQGAQATVLPEPRNVTVWD